jgi:hypothetical protein
LRFIAYRIHAGRNESDEMVRTEEFERILYTATATYNISVKQSVSLIVAGEEYYKWRTEEMHLHRDNWKEKTI